MLSLILSVRQLRQPSGLTQLSRFGSRDLGPPANQSTRVFSMPMPNQIQSGDPINQTPFISKVPWNTGCSSPTARHLHEYARAVGTFDTFEIEMHCDSHSSSVMQEEERGIHYLLQKWLQMQAMQMSRLCVRSAHIPLGRRNDTITMPWSEFTLSEKWLPSNVTKKYDKLGLLWPLSG